MRKRVKVLTVGCKANFADSASIAGDAAAAGLDVVPPDGTADVVVINSCTVTHRAARDSRALARRARRGNPRATVIFAGCYAKTTPGDRDRIPEADHWAGSAAATAALLREIGGEAGGSAVLSDREADLLLGRRRTFLKIQDGCDSRCAYCIVPAARGRSRSEPEGGIVARAVRAEEEGARELVLTGIHIGLYGAERGRKDGLARLIRALLDRTRLLRLRLGSVEPGELTGGLLDAVAGNPRVCPHLHVPLQSGCDRTLARMHRPYSAAEYVEAVSRAASLVPGVRIGADVIAGFPGETAADFEETVRVVRDSPLTALHVFPYSRREGTESARWADDVPPAEKKARVRRLIAVGDGKRRGFLEGQVGRTLDVLAESAAGRATISGLSGNYAEVLFPGAAGGIGELFGVRIESVRGRRLVGVVA